MHFKSYVTYDKEARQRHKTPCTLRLTAGKAIKGMKGAKEGERGKKKRGSKS